MKESRTVGWVSRRRNPPFRLAERWWVTAAPNPPYELKEVLADRDMAVVRLTWTTTTRVKTTGAVEMTEDEGLDVFGRGTDGNWLIVRYMAYQRP